MDFKLWGAMKGMEEEEQEGGQGRKGDLLCFTEHLQQAAREAARRQEMEALRHQISEFQQGLLAIFYHILQIGQS